MMRARVDDDLDGALLVARRPQPCPVGVGEIASAVGRTSPADDREVVAARRRESEQRGAVGVRCGQPVEHAGLTDDAETEGGRSVTAEIDEDRRSLV